MPARDIFHHAVRHALEKDGWTITDDPLLVRFGDQKMYIDLAAEKMIAAQKGEQRIAVEIKSFSGDSLVNDFHEAVGQFMNYQLALKQQFPEKVLYLAAPLDAYEEFLSGLFAQAVITHYQIKLLIFSAIQEEVVAWIK